MSSKNLKWTEEQKAVIDDGNRVQVCIAAAGSGKTQVMTERYRFLVERKGADPSRVLCCSFGNAGVDAIRDRCSSVKRSESSTFSTIHKLGLELLKTFPEYAGRKVRILSGDELLGMIDLSGNGTLKPSDLAGYIQEARERGLVPTSTQDEIGSFCALHDKLRGKEGLFSRAFSTYMERLSELHAEGFVDMADLIILPVTRLQADAGLRQKVSTLYDAILVDEYQDTDVMQQDLLDLIRRPDTWFTVMGDDDQSIYTWRGANPDMIRNLAAREGVEAMRLSTNFRCTKETVEAAECFVEGSPGRVEKELKVVPGATGEIPELRAADGEDKELDEIVAIIKELGKDGYGKNKIAFLARTNSMVAAVKARLKKEGIPVAEMPDRRAIIGKVSTVLSWIEGRSSSAAIMGMAGETCGESLSRMAKTGISGVREEDAWLRENAEGIAADIAQLERPADLSEAIVMAVKIGCFEEHEKASLRKIYAEIKKTPAADISDKLNDLLLEAADPGEEMSEGVVVTTIHQSKGRQFGRVVLDATSGIFPRAGTGKTEEEKRLAYVAFTRAIESLKIVFNARRGLSSLLRDLMDPEKVKGLESYSKYQKQEKGKKNGMHGIVGFPEAWALSAPAVAGREKETAAIRNDVIAAAESDLKRKIESGLLVPGRTRTEE